MSCRSSKKSLGRQGPAVQHAAGMFAQELPPDFDVPGRREPGERPELVAEMGLVEDTLVSGGLDGRVALWNGNTGALLGSVVVASPNVATSAGYAPDGHTVVIASTDGTLARLDTQVEQWISAACTIAGRSLTPAEWAAILPDRPYINGCT